MPSVPGTPNYPAALDDAVSLLEAANRAETTLSAQLTAGATSASVASTSLFPASGVFTVENERIAYTGKTGTSFTGLIRGFDGSADATHASGLAVEARVVGRHHEVLAEALIATQTRVEALLPPGATGDAPVWNGTAWVPGRLYDAQLAADANIDVSKLLESSTIGDVVKTVDGGGGTRIVTWGVAAGLGDINVLHVKADYNAAGDGTTDDTTALQNATNAADQVGNDRGGWIYFDLGVYPTNGIDAGTKQNLRFSGVSSTTINIAGANGSVLLPRGNNQTTLKAGDGVATVYDGIKVEHLGFYNLGNYIGCTALSIDNYINQKVRGIAVRAYAIGQFSTGTHADLTLGDTAWSYYEDNTFYLCTVAGFKGDRAAGYTMDACNFIVPDPAAGFSYGIWLMSTKTGQACQYCKHYGTMMDKSGSQAGTGVGAYLERAANCLFDGGKMEVLDMGFDVQGETADTGTSRGNTIRAYRFSGGDTNIRVGANPSRTLIDDCHVISTVTTFLDNTTNIYGTRVVNSTLTGIVAGGNAFVGNKPFVSETYYRQGDVSRYESPGCAIFHLTTTPGNVGAGEDDIYSSSVPPLTLGRNGDVIEVKASGIFAANTNNKRLRVRVGATAVLDKDLGAINGGVWEVVFSIVRTSATGQRVTARLFAIDAAGTPTHDLEYTAPAETLSGPVTVKVTGEAVADNDIAGRTWEGIFNPSRA